MSPYVDRIQLGKTVLSLVHSAGENKRIANAVKRGAQLIEEGLCEVVTDEAIRIYSDSGVTYLTSLTGCQDEYDEDCPAWEKGFPCKHRAALHLLRLLNSSEQAVKVRII